MRSGERKYIVLIILRIFFSLFNIKLNTNMNSSHEGIIKLFTSIMITIFTGCSLTVTLL